MKEMFIPVMISSCTFCPEKVKQKLRTVVSMMMIETSKVDCLCEKGN